MDYAIAVIDIGMTNKKVAVYDDTLRQLDAQYRVFDPLIVNGLPCHDLDAMETWFLDKLAAAGKQFPIKTIAISTHGANFVCIGNDGKAAIPCVFYTHEPGKDFHHRFYRRFGSAIQLQTMTGTPELEAMINPAKGIFFAQEQFPQEFINVSSILPYPQYWGFRLAGKAGAESTYMGCHTYLWDQENNCLSSVARDMGIADLLPGRLNKSWDVLGSITGEIASRTGLPPDTIVTMGIHDSNASLLPHFAKRGEAGFTLNSTGTWCVMMTPVQEYGFTPEELGKVVFFNISAFGTPVKTAIFLGGHEFETWAKILMAIHRRDDFPSYNEPLYRKILKEANCFLLPELLAGTGQFPGSKPRVEEGGNVWPYGDIAAVSGLPSSHIPPCFADYERGFAVLKISLVMQSLVALERTGLQQGAAVITEGGFRKDAAYNRLLSSALKDSKVYLTGIMEATALGAAMTAKMAFTGRSLAELAGDFAVEYQEVEKSDMPELFSYRDAWMSHAALTKFLI
ncbi:MAG: FGGY family carbohydrate kinase [Treponema sp.]|nr:FGGY family carbohydrate kinase [Treponema sp.]